MAYSGKYKPQNREKYKGDSTKIVWRSLWERRFMEYLDLNKSVKWWSSEPFPVPYISPVDNKYHRYFPDFLMCVSQNNKEVVSLIEIKPKIQTIPPTQKKNSRKFVAESLLYGVNQSKWNAAQNLCTQKGWRFVILTEDSLCC